MSESLYFLGKTHIYPTQLIRIIWSDQLNTEYRIQDTEYRIQSTDYWKQNTEYWILFSEYRIQDTEYRIQHTEYRIQNTEYRIQNTAYRWAAEYRIQQPSPAQQAQPASPARLVFAFSLEEHKEGSTQEKALKTIEALDWRKNIEEPSVQLGLAWSVLPGAAALAAGFTNPMSQSVSPFKLCARTAYPLFGALGLRLTSSQRNKRSRRTRHSSSSNRLYKTLIALMLTIEGQQASQCTHVDG